MPGPYELYLVRHGVAEERGQSWPDDSKRPLTSKGMAQLKKSARGLQRLGVVVDVVLASPLVRTRQTAEIVAGGLDPRPPILHSEALAPGGTYQAVFVEIEKHSRRTRIALVGHEPEIGEFAARLIGARHPIEFKKGAVCRIDVDTVPPTAPGDLRWFLTPRQLRQLRA